MRYIGVIFFISNLAWADASRCVSMKDLNEKHHCMAVANIDLRSCEAIKNMDLKQHCIITVAKEQRRLMALPKPDQRR